VTAIEQIRQQQEQAKLKARADFLILADVLAKDEPTPPDVLDILANAGRTADQLEKAVFLARERLQLEPRAAAFAQIQADRAKADAELKAVEEECMAERAKVEAKHLARINPLRVRADQLREAEQDSRYAKGRLQTLAGELARLGADAGPVTSAGMDRVRSAPRVTVGED
jgi:hypothetical protein